MAEKDKESYLVAFTLDFETGGLPRKDQPISTIGITQVSIHATRLDTFERLGSLTRYIRPYRRKEIKALAATKRKVLKSKFDTGEMPMMVYDSKALEFTNLSLELLEEKGGDIEDVAREVLEFILSHTPKTKKNLMPFLLGQNIEFDKAFFMQMMEYAGLVGDVSKYLRGHEDFYGHWQPDTLDTIMLSQLALCHRPDVTTYQLGSVCEMLGIELDDAHDADADVSATTNVAAVLTRRMRDTEAGAVGSVAIARTEKTRKHFRI